MVDGLSDGVWTEGDDEDEDDSEGKCEDIIHCV